MIFKNPISSFDATLFWDTKVEELNFEKDSFYIIKRIILRGDKSDRILMLQNYDSETIRDVVISSKEIPESLKKVWLIALESE
jgi:hypothetical protein